VERICNVQHAELARGFLRQPRELANRRPVATRSRKNHTNPATRACRAES
jgi:hypothetical protein